MKDGRTTNYGLGWTVSEQNGYRLISAIGIGNNPICAVHVPDEQLYMVYTQFFGTYGQAEIQVKKMLSHLLPLTYPASTKAEAPLTDYTGVYQVHRNGLDITAQVSDVPVYIHITANHDTLYFQQTGNEKIALRPSGKDRFLPAGSENVWYVFSRDEKGTVNAICTQGSFWSYGPEVRNKKVDKAWPKPVTPKPVPADLLKRYAGVYYLPSSDNYTFIEADNGKIFNRSQGRLLDLVPVANNKFVRKDAEDITFEFISTANGSMALVVSGLRRMEYKKLD